MNPASAPHKSYIAFWYVRPTTDETAKQMKADSVKHAVAFTQYPQYSCSTTESSLNELYRRGKAGDMGDGVEWSVVNCWGTHPGFAEVSRQLSYSPILFSIQSVAQRIEAALQKFESAKRDSAVLLFSAHSLPMSVINRGGDPYILEVSASVSAVMERLGNCNPYCLI